MKRWLLKLALFLVLGAIVNVAVAWGCVGFRTEACVVESIAFGSRQREWFVQSAWNFDEQPVDFVMSFTWPGVRIEQVLVTAFVVGDETRAGLPMFALRGLSTMQVNSLRTSAGPVRYDSWGLWEYDSRYPPKVLPLRPIWPGFAINTVFYAVILWLLFAAPFAMRRRRRIKRGLCPKCAYDLRGSGKDSTACPECGAAVSPTVSGARR